MSLDLTLVPIKNHEIGWWLGYERLRVDRDGLGHMICGQDDEDEGSPVETHPLPKDVHFDWYGDNGIERRTTDSYGDALEYALAGDLSKAIDGYRKILAMRNSGCGDPNPDVFNPWNEAVIAFVKALPKDTPIVLWWH